MSLQVKNPLFSVALFSIFISAPVSADSDYTGTVLDQAVKYGAIMAGASRAAAGGISGVFATTATGGCVNGRCSDMVYIDPIGPSDPSIEIDISVVPDVTFDLGSPGNPTMRAAPRSYGN